MLKLTFFSYKGGSGRTTTLYNTLPFLAEKLKADALHPIVIFDMDFKSAGITILLSNGKTFEVENENAPLATGQKHSLQYLVSNNPKCRPTLDDFKATFAESVGNKVGLDNNDAVLLVGANMRYKDDKSMTAPAIFQNLSYYLNRPLAGVSAIIFDSPSGTQDTADVSISKSNVIVCCMRPSYQFRQTTLQYLTAAVDNAAMDAKKRFVLTMTAVPVKDMTIEGKYQITASHQDVMTTVNQLNRTASIKNKDRKTPIIDTDMISDRTNLGIREIERFKWNEKVNLYSIKKKGVEKLSEDEEKALARYGYLASVILKDN